MEKSKQVIQLAKQSALYKFSALVQRMAQDTDAHLLESLSKNAAHKDHRTLSAARQFLREEGNGLLARLEDIFKSQMERALRTMYTDLRSGLGNFSAETLTLIDDEAVNRQIEVGRLVDRLRNSCDENLGRLNIMIAQLHGKSEVRERENPFRPYLMARTLHDVLRAMVKEEATASVLFDYFADSLALYLPEYYAELCEVFDAGGIKAQLVARPGTLKRHQREQLARQIIAAQSIGGGFPANGNHLPQTLPANFDQKVMPSLQRLLKVMQQQTARGSNTNSDDVALDKKEQETQAADLQDFISNIFNQFQENKFVPKSLSGDSASRENNGAEGEPTNADSIPASVSAALLAQLSEYQQLAARGRAVNEQIAPLQNQLFAVREQINDQSTSQPERMAIDVIAVLFEFILGDEQIPEGLRAQIGRLQIPFLKAAMLEPALLHQDEHPSRQLLNRMGSAAVGLAPDTEMGQSVAAEIKRVVKKILDGFDKDISIFSDCLEELEQFLAEKLRHADSNTALSIDAMEEAETISALAMDVTFSLREILFPLNVDKRVSDFIVEIWARVLVRAALQDIKENGADANSTNSIYSQYKNVLPELVWSAQDKPLPQDRTALMRLLPNLVKSLKNGLTMLNLSDEESRLALDQLMGVHTQVLRNNDAPTIEQNLPSLDDLRQIFSGLTPHQESTFSKAVAPPPVDADVIAASLAERGVSVGLDLKRDSIFPSRLDETWLSQMQVGTSVECWIDNAYQLGRLVWVGKNQSLFMFKLAETLKPLVYSSASLSKALNEGFVNLIESAPTFERAVESLLQGTEAIQRKQPG